MAVSKAHGLHVIPDRYGKESLILTNILKETYGEASEANFIISALGFCFRPINRHCGKNANFLRQSASLNL